MTSKSQQQKNSFTISLISLSRKQNKSDEFENIIESSAVGQVEGSVKRTFSLIPPFSVHYRTIGHRSIVCASVKAKDFFSSLFPPSNKNLNKLKPIKFNSCSAFNKFSFHFTPNVFTLGRFVFADLFSRHLF
jgi:hypothetical protein